MFSKVVIIFNFSSKRSTKSNKQATKETVGDHLLGDIKSRAIKPRENPLLRDSITLDQQLSRNEKREESKEMTKSKTEIDTKSKRRIKNNGF